MSSHEPPSVVIVGRPNVGKSTLFNRITSSRRAIVGNQPGITRDRILLPVEWKGRRFDLTDTGGMLFGDEEEFPTLISQQVRAALEVASRVIFVVDGRAELTATDRDLADLLRRLNKPVALAVNKCDTEAAETRTAEFHELGIAEVFAVSAEHARGIGALLDHVVEGMSTKEDQPEGEAEDGAEAERPVRVAIIGRPNVGKSTLLNQLTGKDRAIVSPTPGTTRDAVDEDVVRRGTRFQFVDTAGIRRKGKTREMAEKLSVVMAQRHIRLADVALLLIDTTEGVAALDANIAGYADEAGKALIILVNKWDQAPDNDRRKFEQDARDKLKFLGYAPIHFVSALENQGVQQIFALVRRVHQAARLRISTGELNRFLESVDMDRSTTPGSRTPKIHYVTQAGVGPPTFVFFTNRRGKFHFGFERFLKNQLRRAFDFEGTPLVIKSKAKQR